MPEGCTYRCNGQGRDSYIASNNGGFSRVSSTRPQSAVMHTHTFSTTSKRKTHASSTMERASAHADRLRSTSRCDYSWPQSPRKSPLERNHGKGRIEYDVYFAGVVGRFHANTGLPQTPLCISALKTSRPASRQSGATFAYGRTATPQPPAPDQKKATFSRSAPVSYTVTPSATHAVNVLHAQRSIKQETFTPFSPRLASEYSDSHHQVPITSPRRNNVLPPLSINSQDIPLEAWNPSAPSWDGNTTVYV